MHKKATLYICIRVCMCVQCMLNNLCSLFCSGEIKGSFLSFPFLHSGCWLGSKPESRGKNNPVPSLQSQNSEFQSETAVAALLVTHYFFSDGRGRLFPFLRGLVAIELIPQHISGSGLKGAVTAHDRGCRSSRSRSPRSPSDRRFGASAPTSLSSARSAWCARLTGTPRLHRSPRTCWMAEGRRASGGKPENASAGTSYGGRARQGQRWGQSCLKMVLCLYAEGIELSLWGNRISLCVCGVCMFSLNSLQQATVT